MQLSVLSLSALIILSSLKTGSTSIKIVSSLSNGQQYIFGMAAPTISANLYDAGMPVGAKNVAVAFEKKLLNFLESLMSETV
jgi:hypothetical protein